MDTQWKQNVEKDLGTMILFSNYEFLKIDGGSTKLYSILILSVLN